MTLYLFWPTLWIRPLFLFEAVSHFSGTFDWARYLYFGVAHVGTSVSWHYYPFFVLVCTPLLTWFFIGMGLFRLSRNRVGTKERMLCSLLCLWFFLPLMIRMNPWVVKYDQIRHVFHAIPPLMILAGYGLHFVMDHFRKNALTVRFGRLSGVLYVCGMCYFASQIIPLHPYEGEYFNEGFRLVYPHEIEEHFEFPIWQTPYKAALEWLNVHAEPGAIVRVPYMYFVAELYQDRIPLKLVESGDSTYTLVSGSDYRTRDLYFRKKPLFELRRYESQLVAVYKNR